MDKLIKTIGSIYFTVFITVLLGLLLICSTSLESMHGTAFAQKNFYNTRWFDGLLFLLWLNIFCSTLLRFPFKKSQLSFLITHVGILCLLLGALMARILGVEGQMYLIEGQSAQEITQGGSELRFVFPDGTEQRLPLYKGPAVVKVKASQMAGGICPVMPKVADKSKEKAAVVSDQTAALSFSINKIFTHAAESLSVVPGEDSAVKNHAIHVTLQSSSMNWKESVWLLERSNYEPDANIKSVGPLKIILRAKPISDESATPMMRILSKEDGKELAAIELLNQKDTSVPFKEKGWKISNFKYLPYAKVMGGKLDNGPADSTFNPAVAFDAVGPDGNVEHIIKFALFPDFESMHGSTVKRVFNFDVRFEGLEGGDEHSDGSSLTFYILSDGGYGYRITSKDGSVKEGPVTLKQAASSGWMDIQFTVDETLANARTTYEFKESDSVNGPLAAEIVVKENGKDSSYWLMEGKDISLSTSIGEVQVGLAPRVKKLPFFVKLKDFRKVDYPGTNRPAGFESDVVLTDAEKNLTMERTISMNNPLGYRGYKIFQSSFDKQATGTEASVFTVAKNPGIALIYLGASITFLGAFMLFFVQPIAVNRRPPEK